MIDAVVLAGGELERERFQGLTAAVDAKAEIPILGRPMVEWTVRALRETGLHAGGLDEGFEVLQQLGGEAACSTHLGQFSL